MKFESLKNYLSQNQGNLFCVVGEDEFLRERAVEMLAQRAQPFCEFNMSILNAPTADRIIEDSSIYPLGSGARVVVVREASIKSSKELAKLKEHFTKAMDSTVVIVEPNAELARELAGVALTIECDAMSQSIIIKWINKELASQNRTISNENAQYLIELCQGKMTRLNMELKKLAFVEGSEVTRQAIDDLVEKTAEYKIYALSECVAAKDCQQSLIVLDKLLAQKNEPSSLLSLLYNHFRRIMYCAISPSSPLSSYLGVKEYAVTMAKRQAKLFSKKQLVLICNYLREAEYAIKSGQSKAADCITLAVMKICTL